MKTQIYFFTLLFYEFWYFPFLECIATISKRTTTHFILSHHVRLKVANSHTMSYFCGSWWQGTFTAQYTMVHEIFQMRRYGIVKIVKIEYYSTNCSENLYHHHLCACAKPFWVVLKIGLDLEKFFLQNGFWNTPPNSMKFHKFHGTEQNKSFFPDYV